MYESYVYAGQGRIQESKSYRFYLRIGFDAFIAFLASASGKLYTRTEMNVFEGIRVPHGTITITF